MAFIVFFKFFPVEHISVIEKYSHKYNIDPSFVFAIINVESGFNENAVSSKGASGLMQIMKSTADWAATYAEIENFDYDDIFIPEVNINIGCWYLSWLSERYDGNFELVLAAYNAGTGNVNKWLVDDKYSYDGNVLYNIPFKETNEYVEKVLFREKIYDIILEIYDILRK